MWYINECNLYVRHRDKIKLVKITPKFNYVSYSVILCIDYLTGVIFLFSMSVICSNGVAEDNFLSVQPSDSSGTLRPLPSPNWSKPAACDPRGQSESRGGGAGFSQAGGEPCRVWCSTERTAWLQEGRVEPGFRVGGTETQPGRDPGYSFP